MMDEELKTYLKNMEGRLVEQIRDRLVEQIRNPLVEQIRDSETRLLTEFHKWASPVEARQRTHAAALRAVDLEMEALSDRVKTLESEK